MNELRFGLPPLPTKMRRLPIDRRGYPVPFFVAMVNGEPDHRVIDPRAMKACLEHRRCWICGNVLGSFLSFTVGPMCGINCVSAEPPAHRECARYAARTCPFLSRPHAKRREAGLPEELREPAGVFIMRNPGVTLIWTTRSYRPFRAPWVQSGSEGGVLFDMGPAETMEWYAEGRAATLEEIEAAISAGLPTLIEVARAQADDAGEREIERRRTALLERVRQAFA